MRTSHKVLNKVILLLLFVGFIITITGSAVASSAAGQSQSVQLTVTRDGVITNLDQAQIVCVENGVATAYQISDIKIVYDKYGKIKSVTLKLRQVEKAVSSSTDSSSADDVAIADASESQDATVETTKDSASINASQMQLSLVGSNGVIKQAQVIKIKVKFLKNGQIKVIIKMKQKQNVKSTSGS